MRLQVDDDIYDVDSVYLGPPGHTLHFRARYGAWGVASVSFALMLIIEIQVGIFNPVFVTYTAAAAVFLTIRLMRFVDFDRPIRVALVAIWHEVSAPRAKTLPTTQTFSPPRSTRKAT